MVMVKHAQEGWPHSASSGEEIRRRRRRASLRRGSKFGRFAMSRFGTVGRVEFSLLNGNTGSVLGANMIANGKCGEEC